MTNSNVEIERKFLIRAGLWPSNDRPKSIVQGYLATTPVVCRVRISGSQGKVTFKDPAASMERFEAELDMDVGTAQKLLNYVDPATILVKDRYTFWHAGFEWTVDVFKGRMEGLILGEVEAPTTEELSKLVIPGWVETEVTGDPRYYNNNM